MSRNVSPSPDPLIDEVRQRRRELSERYGNDLGRLCEVLQQMQAEHPERLTDRRPRKPAIASR